MSNLAIDSKTPKLEFPGQVGTSQELGTHSSRASMAVSQVREQHKFLELWTLDFQRMPSSKDAQLQQSDLGFLLLPLGEHGSW